MNEVADSTTDFQGVRIDDQVVASVKGGQTTFALPREKVRDVRLRFGFQAERPLLQLLLGLLLAAVGALQIPGAYEFVVHGGTIYLDVMVFLLLLVPLGAWLMAHGLRRGFYLFVEVPNDRFKIPFRGRPTREAIVDFLSIARARTGYSIQFD
ncbi:MAG TPA: hypothetical protein VF017_15610 [Thermoanaerobaculia bacterium]|nr:hypothetical protein [Thermoanaerobaculia bacterium]